MQAKREVRMQGRTLNSTQVPLNSQGRVTKWRFKLFKTKPKLRATSRQTVGRDANPMFPKRESVHMSRKSKFLVCYINTRPG
jgi:hypothetical protein